MNLVSPVDLLSSDCWEGHGAKDDGKKYDDSEWEYSSSEGFKVRIFLIPDKLGGGEEIGMMHKSSKHFEEPHDGNLNNNRNWN